ncbi:MAG: endonuclease/exonuclease/phosphatase family protein [Alistipes sp.]
MKKIFILWTLIGACALSTAIAQPLNVATYNVRNNNNTGDALQGNGWQNRLPVISKLIQFHDFDLFGSQEVMNGQLNDLLAALPDYGFIGVGRDDGRQGGEYSPVFYKKARLELLKSGNFWLNEHPETPGLGWDAACTRICSWGEFKDKATGKIFYLFNTHFDHVGVVARAESCRLILKKMKQIAGSSTVVLMGDFNTPQSDEVYRILTREGHLDDAFCTAQIHYAQNGTFNNFDPMGKDDARIDHILVDPAIKVVRYGILTDHYWSTNADGQPQLRTPSDHYPVATQLLLK